MSSNNASQTDDGLPKGESTVTFRYGPGSSFLPDEVVTLREGTGAQLSAHCNATDTPRDYAWTSPELDVESELQHHQARRQDPEV